MDTMEALRTMMVESFGLDPAQLRSDARLLDLGVDSLSLIEFGFDVEKRFGINLPSDLALQDATVGQLAKMVDDAVNSRSLAVATASGT